MRKLLAVSVFFGLMMAWVSSAEAKIPVRKQLGQNLEVYAQVMGQEKAERLRAKLWAGEYSIVTVPAGTVATNYFVNARTGRLERIDNYVFPFDRRCYEIEDELFAYDCKNWFVLAKPKPPEPSPPPPPAIEPTIEVREKPPVEPAPQAPPLVLRLISAPDIRAPIYFGERRDTAGSFALVRWRAVTREVVPTEQPCGPGEPPDEPPVPPPPGPPEPPVPPVPPDPPIPPPEPPVPPPVPGN